MTPEQHRKWHRDSTGRFGFNRNRNDDGGFGVDFPRDFAANPHRRPVDYLTDDDLAAWAETDLDDFRAARAAMEGEAVEMAHPNVPGSQGCLGRSVPHGVRAASRVRAGCRIGSRECVCGRSLRSSLHTEALPGVPVPEHMRHSSAA